MKNIKGQHCFTHANGENVYLFTLCNGNGTIVNITNYGAIITAFKVRTSDGDTRDIVLGFDNVADYLAPEYLANYPYFGAAIGRYANRIKDGGFLLDGKKYSLVKNKGTDHLHGGIEGFDRKVWEVISASAEHLRLSYKSYDGEEGYPGNLHVVIEFRLTPGDQLVYEFTAKCDQPTIVNLAHHSYFNLGDHTATIGSHEVKINASNIMEQDDNYVVTGQLFPVAGNLYDFRESKRVDHHWIADDGYDQTFVIDREAGGPEFAAEAISPGSGLKLQVYTTEPVVHFYTGKWIPAIKGKGGNNYGPYSGFCFETHKHPNAINIPGLPNTILRAGETYHSTTIYKITHEPPKRN
jgi:aldose 1-epimerase